MSVNEKKSVGKRVGTGLKDLDRVLQGLMPGDNVVWGVDAIEDYLPFVRAFENFARSAGERLVYFRFARHAPIFTESESVQVVVLDPEAGFERFLARILDIIEAKGPGALYVFDCLSDLAAGWYSDRMLGNFFMIACPFLYKLDTIAYFALLKNHHSFHATDGIMNTAQVILDVYRHRRELYIHPLKVHGRSSPTMYMLHQWKGEEFLPVKGSAIIAEIMTGEPKPWLEFTYHRLGVWTQTFLQAQEVLTAIRSGQPMAEAEHFFFERLLKMAVTRDERFVRLARDYFDLSDLIEILKHMIGTGLIGGKTLGMLMARAILRKNDPKGWEALESHDSFYIGSDVYYTYLVQNGCWWLRRKQVDFETLLSRAEESKEKLLNGVFPEYILGQFAEMLGYFGQSPIIVRSSSLLEDNYGNAFSGKYESIYCTNQGTPRERLEAFLTAVRRVYASTMSREALSYRRTRGLLDHDEQMALLVQRVSGTMYDGLFFPLAAGVGFSFNPYAWSEEIDPSAGMLRLVMGLGTRAVDRHDDDYTRVISLSAPDRRPEAGVDEALDYAQRNADILDLKENQLTSRRVDELTKVVPPEELSLLGQPVEEAEPWIATFEGLFSRTDFISDMHRILGVLQEAYQYPVDVEFTMNLIEEGRYRINLLQCRPFQAKIKREGSRIVFPESVEPGKVLLANRGPIIGPSQATTIDRIIYVVPSVYGNMPISQRYSVARTIGQLTRLGDRESGKAVMLIGPGRWGTSMPSLGVPVSFAEIASVSVLCEIVQMREGVVPDVSLGTHFFNDLVEMDILYLAVFPGKTGHFLNESFFQSVPNRLADLVPEAAGWSQVIRVAEVSDLEPSSTIYLNADTMKQRSICYRESRE